MSLTSTESEHGEGERESESLLFSLNTTSFHHSLHLVSCRPVVVVVVGEVVTRLMILMGFFLCALT